MNFLDSSINVSWTLQKSTSWAKLQTNYKSGLMYVYCLTFFFAILSIFFDVSFLFPSFYDNIVIQETTYPVYILVAVLVILFCVVKDSRGNDDMAR